MHFQTSHQMFEIPIEINRLALKALAKPFSTFSSRSSASMIKLLSNLAYSVGSTPLDFRLKSLYPTWS
jgi:hypothetical protein